MLWKTINIKRVVESAKKNAEYNINSIYEYVKDGAIVVGVEPSCISALKDEYPDMFPEDKRTNLIAESTYLLQELIVKESKDKKFNFKKSDENKSYAVQVHCHEKTIIGENIAIESLKLIPKSQVKKFLLDVVAWLVHLATKKSTMIFQKK